MYLTRDVPSGIKGSSFRRLVNFWAPVSSLNWLLERTLAHKLFRSQIPFHLAFIAVRAIVAML
jgi:hypothetical protein